MEQMGCAEIQCPLPTPLPEVHMLEEHLSVCSSVTSFTFCSMIFNVNTETVFPCLLINIKKFNLYIDTCDFLLLWRLTSPQMFYHLQGLSGLRKALKSFGEPPWVGGSVVKNLTVMKETWVQSLGWEDPLENGMASHSNILVRIILWTEEASRLQFMGLQKVRHNWATNTHTYLELFSHILFGELLLILMWCLQIYIWKDEFFFFPPFLPPYQIEETSLEVQQLKLCTPAAGAMGSIPDRGTKILPTE